jgi:hypothetical protein
MAEELSKNFETLQLHAGYVLFLISLRSDGGLFNCYTAAVDGITLFGRTKLTRFLQS